MSNFNLKDPTFATQPDPGIIEEHLFSELGKCFTKKIIAKMYMLKRICYY
jgi:hypothetical protein